jgi:hypothetical protein
MNLSEYRSELRDRISDNQSIVQTRFTDAQLNSFINLSRRVINKLIPVYENQDYIIPELWIDEYNLPKDFISMGRVYNPFDERYYYPIKKEKAEVLSDDFWYSLVYENLFYINEKRKRITFMKPPATVPLSFTISALDRDANIITIDTCNGAGTVTTVGTAVTLSGDTTSHLRAGYQITVGAETIAIDSITGDQTFTLESAPASDWSADSYTVLESDDSIPDIGSWSSIKPYIRLKATAETLGFDWDAKGTTLTLHDPLDDLDNIEIGMELSCTGIQKNTLVLDKPTALTVLISKPAISAGTDDDVSFYTYEYCRVSKILANSGKTAYTLYVSGWNLKDLNYAYDFTVGDLISMVSYVHEYISNPKNLDSDSEEDRMPLEIQELVTVYAESLCFLTLNLTDRQAIALNLFNNMVSDAQFAIKADKMNILNAQKEHYGSQ